VAEKTSTKEMYDSLVALFQSDNVNQKMILKNKLRDCRMNRSDNVTTYLMRITQIRDQLAAVGETVVEPELVNVALNGFTKSWEPFIKGICAERHSPSGIDYGTTVFRRRLGKSPDPTSKEEELMRTWP
jgi:hypothetical protein